MKVAHRGLTGMTVSVAARWTVSGAACTPWSTRTEASVTLARVAAMHGAAGAQARAAPRGLAEAEAGVAAEDGAVARTPAAMGRETAAAVIGDGTTRVGTPEALAAGSNVVTVAAEVLAAGAVVAVAPGGIAAVGVTAAQVVVGIGVRTPVAVWRAAISMTEIGTRVGVPVIHRGSKSAWASLIPREQRARAHHRSCTCR